MTEAYRTVTPVLDSCALARRKSLLPPPHEKFGSRVSRRGRVRPDSDGQTKSLPGCCKHDQEKKENHMLYTIAVVLLVLWLLGLVTSSTMGGFIHILLVIAVVMVLVNFISGRKPI